MDSDWDEYSDSIVFWGGNVFGGGSSLEVLTDEHEQSVSDNAASEAAVIFLLVMVYPFFNRSIVLIIAKNPRIRKDFGDFLTEL